MSIGRAIAAGVVIVAGSAAAAGAPPGLPPFSGPVPQGQRDFGGWATQRGRTTITGDGRVGTTVGAFTFFDGGLTATRIGNATAWNDGRVSARMGRYQIFSDGVIGVPTRGGTVFTPGFAPAPPHRRAPAP